MLVLIVYAERPHFLRYLLDYKLKSGRKSNEPVVYHAIFDMKYKSNYYDDVIDECYYIEDYFQNLTTTATQLIDKYHYDRIVGVGEQMKYPCQRLKEYAGIQINNINQAKFTNKLQMKQTIQNALDIRRNNPDATRNTFFLPEYKPIYSKLDVIEFITKLGNHGESSDKIDSPTSSSWEDHQIHLSLTQSSIPSSSSTKQSNMNQKAVIKPVALSGCRGVQIVSSIEEVNFSVIAFDESFIIEKFINGEMYHIDGFYHHGQIISYPSRYLRPCAETDFSHPDMSYLIDPTSSIRIELDDFTSNFFDIFLQEDEQHGHNFSFVFHLECFVISKNQGDNDRSITSREGEGEEGGEKGERTIYFCEIASRTGGNNINRNWMNSFGIDLLKTEILMELGSFNISDEEDFPQLQLPLTPTKLSGSFAIHTKQGKLIRHPRRLHLSHTSETGLYHHEPGEGEEYPSSEAKLLYNWNYLEGHVMLSHSSEGFKNRLIYGIIHQANSERDLLDLFERFQQTFYTDIEIWPDNSTNSSSSSSELFV